MAAWDEAMGTALPAGGGGPPPHDVVIDADAIERLRQLDPDGTQGVLGRVLAAYRQSLSRHLDDMASAASGGDLQRLLRIAHTLKSSSAAVGALTFARHCAELEEQCRDRLGGAPMAHVDALIHEGRAVLVAVGAMLAA